MVHCPMILLPEGNVGSREMWESPETLSLRDEQAMKPVTGILGQVLAKRVECIPSFQPPGAQTKKCAYGDSAFKRSWRLCSSADLRSFKGFMSMIALSH